jgi:hypothetical protein
MASEPASERVGDRSGRAERSIAVYRRASAVPVDRVPDSDSPWVSGVGGYL